MGSVIKIIKTKSIINSIINDIKKKEYQIFDIRNELSELIKIINDTNLNQSLKKYTELDIISFATYRLEQSMFSSKHKSTAECLNEWKLKYPQNKTI